MQLESLTHISENYEKPVHRTVLRIAIYICLLELLDLCLKAKKLKMSGLLLAVIGLFAAIVVGSLHLSDCDMRRIFIGFLSSASLISMFASPLCIINLVIQTRNIEFMPFYLSLSTFLMSTSFFLYGCFNSDPFVYVPNGMGTILGIVQLALYSYYKNKSREDCREPLIESCA
ncbi:hypothetical protein F0562_009039 [Nyssa sinensis]|uniref:Bidirectional sugar transporter SWEET n=1 Tax=Nyssa sinensis TaxID=561372 RepID=A0A5J5A9Z4_9ASTE|nr:hypothetical protein F0562_009039 [Nyssa sinensis]